MSAGSNAKLPERAPAAESLSKVLGQSEQAACLVKESAEELSSVNEDLKRQMVGRAGVAVALEKNAAVEHKVEEATEKLAAVNQALEGEVRDRNMVDHQLAAAMEQEEAARYACFHDVLTGLPNRALFNDRLDHGFAQAKRHGWSLAVMFLDLDRFKNINDTYGHDIGDSVLRTVAQRLKDSTRGDDTVSRLGGDEFLYLLAEIRDEKSVAAIAQKIIKAIQAPFEVTVRGVDTTLSVGASIGISIFPRHGTTVDTLIISADMAMYQAKRRKSGFAFAT
jgi:diguanylate cyclase (GGDEF)-like protein